MKKFYSFAIAIMAAFGLSTPSNAEVESTTELFGTWTFTANVQCDDAEYQKLILGESEVKIIKENSGYFDAEIDGLCGVANSYQVATLETQDGTKVLQITNPNGGGYDAWGNLGLWMADTEGNNPYDFNKGYGPIFYTISDNGEEITLPDFTFVSISDWNAEKATIVASVTNAKLTLKEREEIEVDDISGSYEFNAATFHDYGVIEDWPTSFNMDIVSKGEDNKQYDVTWAFEKFDTLHMDGKFDGNVLRLNYSNLLVAYDSIYLVPTNDISLSGSVGFNLVGDNLSMSTGCSFAVPQYNESVELDTLHYIFWYGSGIAKKAKEKPAFDYAGTYDATAVISTDMTEGKLPKSGPVVIDYYEGDGNYYICSFLGFDTYTMNYGGLLLNIDKDDPMKASIEISPYLNYLGYVGETWESGFYVILDNNMENNPIPVTFSEDGTMTVGEFIVGIENGATTTPAAFYSSLTAKKNVPSALDWNGKFKVNDITFAYLAKNPGFVLGDSITISYYENQDVFVVMDFLGNETYYMNYGGMTITPDETNPHKATMTYGTLAFDMDTFDEISLYSADMTKNPVELTLNEDGTVTVGDFSIAKGPYMGAPVKLIANTNVREAQKILWNGDLKLNPVTFKYVAEGATVPTNDTISVSYDTKYDCFIVMSFMGYETYYMNYGAMEIIPDENDALKATITYGILDYDMATNEETSLYSTDLSKTPIELVMEEDGTVTIGGLTIARGPYFGTPTTILLSTEAQTSIKTRAIEEDGRMYNIMGVETDRARGIMIKNIDGKFVKVLYE